MRSYCNNGRRFDLLCDRSHFGQSQNRSFNVKVRAEMSRLLLLRQCEPDVLSLGMP